MSTAGDRVHAYFDAAPRDAHRIAALAFVVGAGIYALALGGFDVTFNSTPAWFGLVAAIAGIASRQPRLVSISMPLLGWGLAVLLVREGPLPHGREAAAFLVGAGAGMLAAALWSRIFDLSATGAALTVLSGGLAFYLAFDIDALNRWPTWTVLMLVWAAYEWFTRRPPARTTP